ncbi:MAG: FAD-dependent oxidoreductase [Nonlabens sp.]
MKVDQIIIGSGIAGCCIAWELYFQNKSFVLISDQASSSSSVAAGVYNPTILKRFTSVWNGATQLDHSISFYENIEQILNVQLLHPIPILRRLHNSNEAKTWVNKSIKPELSRFMNSHIHESLNIDGIDAPHGYGEVLETGWLDTIAFMNHSLIFFKGKGHVIKEKFDFDKLKLDLAQVAYDMLCAPSIIFADGFRMTENPIFKHLPMQGNKGEVLTIQVEGLHLDYIIKSSVFLMPYKDDLFWVGATYNRDDLSDIPTAHGFDFLTSRLKTFLKLPYNIKSHKAGIRPTTIDRRPFVGIHFKHKNVICFNGMGSRAVLVSPWAASNLVDHLYNDALLPAEMDIARFY